jgi:hypothetical protein
MFIDKIVIVFSHVTPSYNACKELLHIKYYCKKWRHVAPPANIILIPSQPVFALCPKCYMLRGEATNANFIIVFGMT